MPYRVSVLSRLSTNCFSLYPYISRTKSEWDWKNPVLVSNKKENVNKNRNRSWVLPLVFLNECLNSVLSMMKFLSFNKYSIIWNTGLVYYTARYPDDTFLFNLLYVSNTLGLYTVCLENQFNGCVMVYWLNIFDIDWIFLKLMNVEMWQLYQFFCDSVTFWFLLLSFTLCFCWKLFFMQYLVQQFRLWSIKYQCNWI